MKEVIMEGLAKVVDVLFLGILLLIIMLIITWTMGWPVFVGSMILIGLAIGVATGKIPLDPKLFIFICIIGFILLFSGFIIPQLTIGEIIEMTILKPLSYLFH